MPFHHSLFVLDGNVDSPILLLGPLQGDSVGKIDFVFASLGCLLSSRDHTLFWLPTERTIICGDAVYARSTHVWVEEVETPQLLGQSAYHLINYTLTDQQHLRCVVQDSRPVSLHIKHVF